MHGLSSSDAPLNLRDASVNPWKKQPTKISLPTNQRPQPPRSEAMRYDFSTRLSGSQKKNERSSRLIGNIGARALQGYKPNKRQKLDSGTKRGGKPVLAPESTSDDELIIVSRDPSTDDLNITDTPYLSPTSDSSTKPSSSRLVPDGENTKWLQQQLGHASAEAPNAQGRPTKGEDSSDVIETDDITELPGRDGTVKSKIAKLEEARNRGFPRVDLAKIKNKMKPKDTQRNPSTLFGDRLTSSTQFTKSSSNSKTLSLASFFLGHKFYSEPLFVKWGVGSELSIYQRVQTGSPKLLVGFRPMDHFVSMTYTENPEECKNFVLVKITTCTLDPDFLARYLIMKLGDELAGALVLKFDDQDKTWSPGLYHQLIDWLKANIKDNHVIRGYATARSVWEETQRLSDNTNTNQKRGTASTSRSAQAEPKDGSSSDTRAVSRTRKRLSHEDNDPFNTYAMPNSEMSAMNTSNARRRTLRSNVATIKSKSPARDADEVILVYPQGVPGAVNITNADLSRLQPGEFLNDTLIEFGLKYWHRELETTNPELAKQIHVFSSFFYKKLNKKKTEEGYESIRKWTSKFDIFDKKYIIIPINENVHWYLAIIYEPEHTLLPPPLPVTTPTTRRNVKEAISKLPLSRLQVEPTDMGVTGESSVTSEDTASGSGPAEASSIISSTEIALSIPGDFVTVGEAASGNDGGVSSPLSPLPDNMDVDDGAVGSRTSRASSPTVSEMEIEQTALTVLSRTASLETMDHEPMPIPADRFYALSADKAKVTDDSKGRIEQDHFETEVVAENECHTPKTYIFTMDSLGSRHPQAINKLARYLKLEAQDKKQLSEDKTSTATGRAAPVPFQPNYCDCGIYLLHLAKTFMTDPAGYCQKILETKASVANEERQNLWNDHEVADIRETLSNRIRQLSAEWKRDRAAREEAKKENKASLDVLDSSDDDEIDIVETTIPNGPTPRKRRLR